MYQGSVEAEERNRRSFDFDPKRIAAVLLTHAHADHYGLIPKLIQSGFSGKVICTRATAEFVKIGLQDRGAGNEDLWPDEALKKLDSMFECPDDKDNFKFGHSYALGQDIFYSFLRTAHIVGSVAIEIRVNTNTRDNVTTTFSGDLGTTVNASVSGGLQKKRQNPNPSSNVIVCESTNGLLERPADAGGFNSRIEAMRAAIAQAFTDSVNPVIIMPTFSLQRTQDLLFDLDYVFRHGGLPDTCVAPISILVSSGLAQRHSNAMLRAFQQRNHKGERMWLNTDSPLFANLDDEQIEDRLRRILTPGGSGSLFSWHGRQWHICTGHHGTHDSGPKIILAGPGMCMGGTSLELLARHASSTDASIIFAGYVPASSPAFRIRACARGEEQLTSSTKPITLGTTQINPSDICARIYDLGAFYSGHADSSSLAEFILRKDTSRDGPPLTVVLNHGDRRAREALSTRLKNMAQSGQPNLKPLQAVYMPERTDQWLDLVSGEWIENQSHSSDKIDAILKAAELDPELRRKLDEIGL